MDVKTTWKSMDTAPKNIGIIVLCKPSRWNKKENEKKVLLKQLFIDVGQWDIDLKKWLGHSGELRPIAWQDAPSRPVRDIPDFILKHITW